MLHILAVALAPAAAMVAPDWQFVDESLHHGSKWYFDKRSLVVAGIYRSATIKVVHGPKLGGRDVYFKSYDCLNRTSTPLSVKSTRADGKVIVDLKYRAEDVTAEKPPPGSVSESVLNAVCG